MANRELASFAPRLGCFSHRAEFDDGESGDDAVLLRLGRPAGTWEVDSGRPSNPIWITTAPDRIVSTDPWQG